MDMRRVNSVLKKRLWPLPKLEELLVHLAGSTRFANFDLLKGYWQFPLSEEAMPLHAFVTHNGQYEFTRVTMGSAPSSAHFQEVMTETLQTILYVKALVFLDDVLVHAKSDDELVQSIRETLHLLNEKGIKLRPSKCELYSKRLVWCGRELSEEGVGVSPEFQRTLLDMPRPVTGADLQQFLAAANWIRGMIPEYARKVAPLQDLLNEVLKDLPRRNKVYASKVLLEERGWYGEDGQQSLAALAYEALKSAIAQSVANAYPKDDYVFCLWTDASEISWGSMLTQVPAHEFNDPDLTHNDWHHEPLAFLSGVFKGSQRR